ncbi:PASTA domain-containing protein [Brevibacterium sp. R8603A2]|uniref:protein kinase domain-containing protein n=1 Tax=Brevibacterium sp. R8603A2 TaxID=2929779 RepID=UPI001FF8BB02|nr:PASTA domain-containing protein [Brevibacterium sp. R8603A2]MCK1804119.1 PASTA domain-containing protein [Brevibacterium sp. R8603A2]
MMALQDPLLGIVLDERYRIEAVVARGGMAMVYRGTDLRLDREVAIKVMHAHLLSDDTFVERFKREAINAARLSHPNLVAVHDQGRDGDVVYLVMEYLESVTLRKELGHRGRLSPRQAIVVMDSILAALEAVHAAGIIHRDLKPDNVLLGTDGQIKLADFGLARAVTSATTTKTLIGTVGYVAPELVTRTGADARTDLYTLGIMFYEMLTGSQPYTDEVPIQVAYRHVHDSVPAPSESRAGISPLLDAIVLWATSREPDDRPGGASALRTALTEARMSLSEAELDLATGDGDPTAHSPVLTATMVIDEDPEQPEPKEPRARTDEIPYLADEEDDDAERDVDTGAAQDSRVAAAGASAGAHGAAGSTGPGRTKRTRMLAGSGGGPHGGAGTRPGGRRGPRKRVAGVLAAAVALGLVAWGVTPTEEPMAAVPAAVAGQDQRDASRTITDAGLEVRTHEVFNTAVPAGKVVGTEPGPGTELAPDSVVTVLVSKGEELFGTPDTAGGTEEEARTALEEAGLTVGTVSREHSSSVPDGEVMSQSVEAGAQVSPGTAVDLVVSKGVAPVTVPIVTGLEYDTAFGKLTRLGFLVAKEEKYDDSVEKGRVISQWPRGEKQVGPGELVILTVSKGKEPADGEKKDEAESEEKTD